MDIKRAYKLCAGAIAAALLAAITTSSYAQSGSCPDYTSTINTPYNTYPGPTAFCASSSNQDTVIEPAIPCQSGIRFQGDWPIMTDHDPLIVVPPAGQTFPSGKASVAFAVTVDYVIPSRPIPVLVIYSYNAASMQIGVVDWNQNPYAIQNIDLDTSTYYFVTDWFGGSDYAETINMVAGGYLRFEMTNPPASSLNRYYISSVRIIDSSSTIPEMCSGPALPQPSTPTPSPTASTPTSTPQPPTTTPTGTYTPPTPSPTVNTPAPTATGTLWPTSPPIGYTPRPTSTPIVQATRPVPMPTPLPGVSWPALSFPDVSFPTPDLGDDPNPSPINIPQWGMPTLPDVNFPAPEQITAIAPTLLPTVTLSLLSTPSMSLTMPIDPGPVAVGLTPNATTEASLGAVATTAANAGIMATRWYTTTYSSIGLLQSGDTGISTTVETVASITGNMMLPISYIKSTQIWLPNIWPFILFLMLAMAWMMFITILKFWTHNGVKILEIIRRLIELIPGF